jgi:hypothetical protein
LHDCLDETDANFGGRKCLKSRANRQTFSIKFSRLSIGSRVHEKFLEITGKNRQMFFDKKFPPNSRQKAIENCSNIHHDFHSKVSIFRSIIKFSHFLNFSEN